MAVYQLDDVRPRLGRGAWVAPDARVIGNVVLEDDVSVWFGSVVRGDNEPIRIGRGSNVQELCMLHCDPGLPLTVGAGVTVGHQATLHGCTIGDGALIGIGAIVLNGAVIGPHCLVGAGALVTEGKVFEPGTLILGSPARAVKTLTPEAVARMQVGAAHYVAQARRFATQLTRVDSP